MTAQKSSSACRSFARMYSAFAAAATGSACAVWLKHKMQSAKKAERETCSSGYTRGTTRQAEKRLFTLLTLFSPSLPQGFVVTCFSTSGETLLPSIARTHVAVAVPHFTKKMNCILSTKAVSYTHLTLPTIYSV